MSSLYYMTTRDTYTAEGDLLPIGEAARLLGVSIETIRRWDRAGRLPSTRTLGGQRRFARADVERARNGSAASVLTSGVCQQCGATTEECREGVSEERTCCEECDHYPARRPAPAGPARGYRVTLARRAAAARQTWTSA